MQREVTYGEANKLWFCLVFGIRVWRMPKRDRCIITGFPDPLVAPFGNRLQFDGSELESSAVMNGRLVLGKNRHIGDCDKFPRRKSIRLCSRYR